MRRTTLASAFADVQDLIPAGVKSRWLTEPRSGWVALTVAGDYVTVGNSTLYVKPTTGSVALPPQKKAPAKKKAKANKKAPAKKKAKANKKGK